MGALAADAARAGPGSDVAAQRARIDPPGGFPVTLTAVHPAAPVRGPVAPVRGRPGGWRRELAMIRQTVAGVDEPQVVAGDFNATGITGRSANSWRRASWIARTPARTGPGPDSPGHRYL